MNGQRTHCEHGLRVGTHCRVCAGEFGTVDFYVSSTVTPNRNANRKYVHRPVKEPSWEKGVAGEQRPGGHFVPYLNEHGSPEGIKKYHQEKRKIDEGIKKLKTHPAPFLT